MIESMYQETKESMQKSIDALKNELKKMSCIEKNSVVCFCNIVIVREEKNNIEQKHLSVTEHFTFLHFCNVLTGINYALFNDN